MTMNRQDKINILFLTKLINTPGGPTKKVAVS